MTLELFVHILLLVLVANGAPVLATFLCRSRAAFPLDLGRRLADGRPLFGASKTWRGLAAALMAASLCACILGYDAGFGLIFGALAMGGDLVSSFIKRRRGLSPGARCLALDQLPEALLPAGYAVFSLQLSWWWAILLAMAFMLAQIALSRPLYLLRIRKRPY
jgi:hypothetical protein